MMVECAVPCYCLDTVDTSLLVAPGFRKTIVAALELFEVLEKLDSKKQIIIIIMFSSQ